MSSRVSDQCPYTIVVSRGHASVLIGYCRVERVKEQGTVLLNHISKI